MGIAKDGIIDRKKYDESDIKIAFLLKEVNAPELNQEKNDWEYADWIYEQATETSKDGKSFVPYSDFHKTFGNIVRWLSYAYGLTNDFMECEDYSPYKSALLNSAMININKGGGESSSEDEELYRYGEQNKELLKEQIKEISPDIVICGGTYGIARYAIFDEPKEIRMKCGAYAFRYDGILFVQFVHPAWFSVGRNILYSYFKSVWDEAKNLVIK